MLCAFDFDGTLGNSREMNYQAAKSYCEQWGLPLPGYREMDMVFGNSNPSIIFKGWGEKPEFLAHLDRIYHMTDDLFSQDPSVMPLYKGIKDLLEDLDRAHYTMAIVTSRAIKPVLALIEYHGIKKYFKTIRAHEDIQKRGYRGKPYPDKLNCVLRELDTRSENAVMIGDTFMDISMAKSAGVKAIGVSWGFHDESILLAHGADKIVQTAEDLNQAIRGFLPVSK
jgi:phosphoglycolate phosphatase